VRSARLLTTIAVTAVALLGPAAPALAIPGGARPGRLVTAVNSCGPSSADQLTETPWPLVRLQPAHAWQLSRGGGVTVAVIDAGVSDQHPKLSGKVLPGKDYTAASGGDATCDAVGHGTMVAAIIAGKDTTDAPYSGIAPDARILPLRVMTSEQSNDPQEPTIVAQAIRDAIASNTNVQVINLSLDIHNPTKELADAVQSALDHNIVVVAAAGNGGGGPTDGQPVFPAAYPGVIAVAGTDQQDQRVSTSSSGSYVDVAAPGLNIVGPVPRGGGYGLFDQGGTSFAAAYVSGVAALIKAYNQKLSPAAVADQITRTADHPPQGRNNLVGYGVVNPYQAVASVFGTVRSPRPALTGKVAVPEDAVDAHAALRRTAGVIAGVALPLALLILVGAPVLRRGRARRWRPGRTARDKATRDEQGAPGGRRDEFTPVVGRAVSITAPGNRRPGAAQPPSGVRPPPFPGGR
jgi:membrane-anchored mycosin MYCP